MARSLPVALMGFAVVASIVFSAPGVMASDMPKDVDIAPIPGRVGGLIRELALKSIGGGQARMPMPYRLEMVLQESVLSTLVDVHGKVSPAVCAVHASFRLIEAQEVVLQGTSHARAQLEPADSPAHALEDCEKRVALTIVNDLQAQLSGYLARP